LVCAWDCATANVHDVYFHPLIAQFGDTIELISIYGILRLQ
jgi:hypothetical protein